MYPFLPASLSASDACLVQSDATANLTSILPKVEGSALPTFEPDAGSDFLFAGRGGVGGMRATQAPPLSPFFRVCAVLSAQGFLGS